jgi:putative membrane protein
MSKTYHGFRYASAIIGLSLVALASMPAGAQQDAKQVFVQKATFSNLFEIEAAKLTIERGKDDSAKQFARDMVMDHTKAQADLASAAAKENIRLPTGLDDEGSKKLAALKSAPDSDFDQAYLSTQVAAHEEAVSLFAAFAKNGPDGPIKNFAASTIGTLRTHTIKAHGLTDTK